MQNTDIKVDAATGKRLDVKCYMCGNIIMPDHYCIRQDRYLGGWGHWNCSDPTADPKIPR